MRSATWVREKFVAFFKFILLVDGIDIDVAEPLDLGAEVGDLGLYGIPVDIFLLIVLIGLGDIDLKLFLHPLGEVFDLDLQLAEFELDLIHILFDLRLACAVALAVPVRPAFAAR